MMLDVKGLEAIERLREATFRVGGTSAALDAAEIEFERTQKAYQEAMDRKREALAAWKQAVEEKARAALIANVLLGTPI